MLIGISKAEFNGMVNCPICGRMHLKGRRCPQDNSRPYERYDLEEKDIAKELEARKYEKEMLDALRKADLEIMGMRF